MPQLHSRLALDLSIRDTVLDISIVNHASKPARVWDRSNSWGWETLSLGIKGPPPSEDYYQLTVKPAVFTRNGPGFTEIPPAGGTQRITISAGNPQWDDIERIEHLRGDSLWVRAYLRVPPSPEAGTYGVFVGEVISPLRESRPPHRWLFPGS